MGFTKDEGICRFADEVEALAGTQLSTHLSSPLLSSPGFRARDPRFCPAVRPRARLGLSISHCPVALGTVEGGSVRTPSCKPFRGPGMELPDPVRQRLGNFSRTVFSDSNRTGPEYSEGPDNEMVSSLALQMSLYFNTYFFPLWWVSSIMMLQIKVPELAGFWLLSLLLQLPLILFLLFNEGLTNLPLEKAIHIIFTLFLTFQVVSAFLTLRKMVNQLATRFHLQDFDRLSAYRGGMRRMRSCIEEI
ncbi:transmembrane protein 17 isoform X2 [Hyaena hyaena]|uniref:transmembrane protein 17 isoform X2 n=1 Tax=Hyaena hyaena TaxID=95912 RepID=UPI0019226873|nr:transmembrane protein 17 isoform X2 [Hyaena hyaena]